MQKKTRSLLLITSTLVLTVASSSVLAGYRYFNDRPAQDAAAQFFPASAMLMVTADIKPGSPEQVLTFKRISDALKTTDIRPKINEMRDGFTADLPLAQEIWPHLNRSVAAMTWSQTHKVNKTITQKVAIPLSKPVKKGKKTAKKTPKTLYKTVTKKVMTDVTDLHVLTALSIDDATSVRKILDDNAKRVVDKDGLHLVYLKDIDVVVTVVGDYLLIGDVPASLWKAVAVQSGRLPAMTKTAGFMDAKTHLPSDANIFFYLAPSGMQTLQSMAGEVLGNTGIMETNGAAQSALGVGNTLPPTGIAWAMTIREEGVSVDSRIPWKDNNPERASAMTRLLPISSDAYAKMPAGALGIFSLSQLGGYWDVVDASLTTAKDRNEMKKTLADLNKETGMNLPSDAVSGLKGNFLVGIYPAQKANKETKIDNFEFLVIADGENGATPNNLVTKLQAMAKKQNDNKPVFASEKHQGETFWHLMQDAKTPVEEDSFESRMRYTVADNTFQMASSTSLLEQSLQARRGGKNLILANPEYAKMQSRMVPGAQMGLLLSPSAVLHFFSDDIAKALDSTKLSQDDILNVFGEPGKGGMVISAGYTQNIFTSQMVLPINYERAIRLLEAGVREITKDADAEAKGKSVPVETSP